MKIDFDDLDLEPATVLFERIPAELRALPQWVAWRYETREGKRTKMPIDPRNGARAKANDPATWTNFRAAVAAAEQHGYDGIGYEPTAADPFVLFDLDHCRDAATGTIQAAAQTIVDDFATYTEASPSGTGLRLVMRARKPASAGCKKTLPSIAIEVYEERHFLTMTGDVVGEVTEIRDCQAALDTLCSELWPAKAPPEPRVTPAASLEDRELVTKMLAAKNGHNVAALYHGDTSAYEGDDSSADAALLTHLAWWTNNDADQMERIFRGSGLYREKWERADYREMTIDFALDSNGGAGYSATAGGAPGVKEPADEDSAPPDCEDEGPDATADDPKEPAPDRDSPVPVYSGIDLATMKIVEPEPIIEGLAYVACSTYLMGKLKGGGKTTAALDLCGARRGDEWCGKHVRPGATLYLTEQSPQSFNPQCALAGLLGMADFHVIYHRDVAQRGLVWPQVGDLVISSAARAGVDLVFIDNFSLWVGFAADDESSSGAGNAAMAVVEKMTIAGLAVVALQHTRKEGGTIYEAARGSTAIAGRFDELAWIKGSTFPRRRVIQCVGRVFPEDPEDMTIELDENHHYRSVGKGSAVAEHDAETIILGHLPLGRDGAKSEDDVIAVCKEQGIGRDTTSKTLRRLCDPADQYRQVDRACNVIPGFKGFGYWRRAEMEMDL